MAVVPAARAQTHVPTGPINSPEGLRSRLSEAGLYDIPVQIEEVAEFLGIEVVRELMEDNISGYLEFRDGVWVAGVNALHHPNRQRFTIAHEIAHYFLHRDPAKKFIDQNFARRNTAGGEDERAADNLAADLLMPEDKVRSEIQSGNTSLKSLANLFRVSSLAMRYRVQNLGYLVK